MFTVTLEEGFAISQADLYGKDTASFPWVSHYSHAYTVMVLILHIHAGLRSLPAEPGACPS